ncbi:MAG: retroviral-like aspartic protease family protein [Planctomycetota bacterium]|nr:retroviral-like aspartic protease family protein [Planctomycetota bacterium]
MGYAHADLTLFNIDDEAVVSRGLVPGLEVRKMDVRALVDTGAATLIITPNIKEQLGLRIFRKVKAALANESEVECEEVRIGITFRNRGTVCEALVVPGAREVLLGVIPIEAMDVIINPKKQELDLPPDRPYIAKFRI